jgi:CRISPR-associated protein Csb3
VKDPEKVSALRVGGPFQIRLAWWLDEERGRQSPFKLWSAHGTSLSILTALRDETTQLAATIESDKPFDRRTASSTRFGLDPGAGWNSLDAGFSPNEQKMRTLSSPLVELFAALALQRFVPVSTEGHGEVFRYSTWTIPCGAAVAAAVASGVVPGSTDRTFSFRIVDRGKFGCFTTATEITRTP